MTEAEAFAYKIGLFPNEEMIEEGRYGPAPPVELVELRIKNFEQGKNIFEEN